MKKTILLILVIAIASIGWRLTTTYIAKRKAADAQKNMGAPAVTVMEIKNKNVIRQFEAPARVVAKYRVDVLARINGYLTKSYFKEGDYVKAGQVLFEIEPQEYEYAANKAKANLDNAKSQSDYYQKQLARYEELVKQDYVARSDYDNILAQSNAYNAQVESAMSAYRDAQRNLGYTKVKSPVNGRVGIIDVTVGNFVTTMSGALTTVNSTDPMYVTFPLNSKDFVELTRIDKSANVNRDVEFIFSSGTKYEEKGIQDFHDNKVDETTGTITLRATFPNKDGRLIQGDFGRVIIYSRSEDSVPVIPQSASQENQEGRYVYILDANKHAKLVYIKTGGQTSEGEWIVAEGLKAGDIVITSGLQGVIPGKDVRIVNSEAETKEPVKQPNFFVRTLDKIKKIFE